MEVDSGQKHILTACQDRNIRVYNVSSGKHSKTYKGSVGEDGSLIKVSIYRIFSNLIHTRISSALVFADFLNEKRLFRGSYLHLSFNRPLATRQTESVMSDDGESDE